ncbi:MAG: hypothetical protein ACLUDU_11045 [Butyricimonas faecihominis]
MEKVNVFFRCLVVATLVVLGACTDYQYVDTGLANGKHDCTVWEYLHSQPDDWDSTIIMIEHAGMKEYFDGSRQNEQITFFGITNLSILAYMLDYKEAHPTNRGRWQDIPVETRRHILKRLIIPQRLVVRIFREDVWRRFGVVILK